MAAKKLTKVSKSNEINQANFSDFSLSCYRVLLNLVAKMQRYNKAGELIPVSLATRECSLSVVEYANEFNIEPDNAYSILKDATDKLMKTSFSIQKGIDILKINVCSQAYYRKSQGRIDIEFTPNIMPHLAELEGNFTMYHLSDIAGFDSIYTTRLYEMLMQFKTTGILKISIKQLRFELGCVDIFKQYYDFKIKTFGHAVKEINSKWQMSLSFTEFKTGRFITEIHFTFLAVSREQRYDPVKQKMRTQVGKYKKIKKPKSES